MFDQLFTIIVAFIRYFLLGLTLTYPIRMLICNFKYPQSVLYPGGFDPNNVVLFSNKFLKTVETLTTVSSQEI